MSGIVKDVWKVVEPVAPVAKTSKKNLGEDFEVTEPASFFDIRGENGSVRVACKSGEIALQKLINFFKYVRHEIGDERLITDGIGFRTPDDSFNLHEFESTTSVMKVGDVAVYFVEQKHDEGLARVVVLLVEMQKTHKNLYTKFGIEPIQR